MRRAKQYGAGRLDVYLGHDIGPLKDREYKLCFVQGKLSPITNTVVRGQLKTLGKYLTVTFEQHWCLRSCFGTLVGMESFEG